MIRLVAAVLLVAAVAGVRSAAWGHDVPVHQHITREAAKVWRDAPYELTSRLDGPTPINRICTVRFDQGDDIITGSAEEDQEYYPILCPGRPPRYSRGFLEHFWDPDAPNVGGTAVYDQGFSEPSVWSGERFASSYRKAQELWDRRVICNYTGQDRKGNRCPVDKDQAYYWLGRVAHLLEDLTVPAHVHNTPHDPLLARFVLQGKDPFEDFVKSNVDLFKGANYQGREYRYEDLPGLALQQQFRWTDVHPAPTNLFKLFWFVAQKTQYYATGGGITDRVGDGGTYRTYKSVKGKTVHRFDPPLWETEGKKPVGRPGEITAKLPQMAADLVPHALRAVAGLYRLFWDETHPTPRPVITASLVGVLSTARDGKLYLVPLVEYEAGEYRSVYVESWNEDRERLRRTREMVEGVKRWQLYLKGTLVGVFEVAGIADLREDGGAQVTLAGAVRWGAGRAIDIGKSGDYVIALSWPVPQAFWPRGLQLTLDQAVGVDRILDEALGNAGALLTKEIQLRGVDYRGVQRRIGAAPKTRVVEVMDLDRDGRPEIYASVRWAGEPCAEMRASILATWRGAWKVLRRSIYMSECPWFEHVGDDDFGVIAVDIDGDSVAELIIHEGRGEAWTRALYEWRDSSLRKKLDIGRYGS